jgi:hypothetical protein
MEPSTTTTALATKPEEKEVKEVKEVPLGCRFGAFFFMLLLCFDGLTVFLPTSTLLFLSFRDFTFLCWHSPVRPVVLDTCPAVVEDQACQTAYSGAEPGHPVRHEDDPGSCEAGGICRWIWGR